MIDIDGLPLGKSSRGQEVVQSLLAARGEHTVPNAVSAISAALLTQFGDELLPNRLAAVDPKVEEVRTVDAEAPAAEAAPVSSPDGTLSVEAAQALVARALEN